MKEKKEKDEKIKAETELVISLSSCGWNILKESLLLKEIQNLLNRKNTSYNYLKKYKTNDTDIGYCSLTYYYKLTYGQLKNIEDKIKLEETR